MVETKTHAAPTICEIELRPLEPRGDVVPLDAEVAAAPQARGFSAGRLLFLFTFVIPVAVAAIYLFLIASDRYLAEAKFLVRSAGTNSGLAGVEAMMGSGGLSRATDETYAVNEYMMSRDAMKLVSEHQKLREILSRPEADFINRFPNFYSRNNLEEMYRVYQRMVYAYIDGSTGISTLEVTAFRAEDARDMAAAVLDYAEGLINRLNDRARQDALGLANRLVESARRDVADVQVRLTEFRNRSGMVDTSRESAQALDAIARLSNEVAQIEASISQQQALAPNSPVIAGLQEKAQSYRDEINRERAQIVGHDSSMTAKLGAFEKLVLERELAAKALASAENNRDRARQEAEQQHLYLQVIVAPNMPDQAKYPRRLLYFAASCIAAFLVYVIARSFVESAVEHA
jgi:capsular polysaccharide transport system permease protein